MIAGYMWPDIVITVIVLLVAVEGFTRGFVSEVAGAIAIGLALLTPWWYSGAADATLRSYLHLAPGAVHIVGMILTGVVTYAIVMVASRILGRFAKLPIINVANSLGGAVIGALKSVVFLWFVLFVALFFPLTPGLRSDLHRSKLVSYLASPNTLIDDAIVAVIPPFTKSFVTPYFKQHHV